MRNMLLICLMALLGPVVVSAQQAKVSGLPIFPSMGSDYGIQMGVGAIGPNGATDRQINDLAARYMQEGPCSDAQNACNSACKDASCKSHCRSETQQCANSLALINLGNPVVACLKMPENRFKVIRVQGVPPDSENGKPCRRIFPGEVPYFVANELSGNPSHTLAPR